MDWSTAARISLASSVGNTFLRVCCRFQAHMYINQYMVMGIQRRPTTKEYSIS